MSDVRARFPARVPDSRRRVSGRFRASAWYLYVHTMEVDEFGTDFPRRTVMVRQVRVRGKMLCAAVNPRTGMILQFFGTSDQAFRLLRTNNWNPVWMH